MPELKQNFSQAKMNKDMDERVVPKGQYRDALNIQIATSDGANVGTAQTLRGNTVYNTMQSSAGYYGVPDTATVVGSIADPSKDKIYYLVSAGDTLGNGGYPSVRKDYVMEYDVVRQSHKYVFVDIFRVTTATSTAEASNQAWINVDAPSTINKTGIRIGMTVAGTIDGVTYGHSDNLTVSNIIFNDTADDDWKVYLEKDGVAFNDASASGIALDFKAPRVLDFAYNNIITAINILDDTIFWTDGETEPKKLNITRSIAGTGGITYLKGTTNAGYLSGVNISSTSITFAGDTDYFHTRLTKSRDTATPGFQQNLEVITRADLRRAVYVEQAHVTVIKQAPKTPLELDMYRSATPRVDVSGAETPLFTSHSNLSFFNGDNSMVAGDSLANITFNSSVDFRVGDIVVLVRQNATDEGNTDFETFDARGTITASNVSNPNSLSSSGFSIELTYIRSGIPSSDIQWYIRLDGGDTFFKFKLPRFSYRYKYQDGEYSTFAPWSEVAFLTDYYEFLPKKGYNLGMVNQLRSLKIKGYVSQELDLPRDVAAIDILYKETNNPTVSIVKTITPKDDHPLWPDNLHVPSARGEFELATDLIHAVVPSNQLLRPYDNVPRKAIAQEVSANRIIYGNYLQGFNINKEPTLSIGYKSKALSSSYGLPSVKSERTYQLGVVFSDKYGRETPVISGEYASVEIPKQASMLKNNIVAQILPANLDIPSWAEYYSFYIKEPTIEYYNLSMDKWYKAEDGNIWLSFPSSERNKLDEETFIGMKKMHGKDGNTAGLERRYKVLAIDNEAPDDIKIRRTSLGSLQNGSSVSEFAIGNQTNGWPQIGATYITIDIGAFELEFGDLTTLTKDSLDLRFRGGWQGGRQSAKYEILSLTKDESHYKLKIEGMFGEDVQWIAGDTQAYNMIVGNLNMELFENETINRPEFDGRFFAKVYKDAELEEYLNAGVSEQQYSIAASWGLRYVNNNGYCNAGTNDTLTGVNSHQIPLAAVEVPAGSGDGGDDDQQSQDQTGNTNFTAITYNLSSFESMSTHPTEFDWSDYVNYDGDEHDTYYWGGEGANSGGAGAYGVSASHLQQSAVKALNGKNLGSYLFWSGLAAKKQFFIDACTAYSWTAENNDRPGSMFATDMWTGTNADATAESNENSTASSSNYGGIDIAGNGLDEKGQPSRGIWNNGKHMDISWTGMGAGAEGDGNVDEDEQYAVEMEKMALEPGVWPVAWQFIKTLVTPGCKFKFNRDPDSTVYTVSDYKNYTAGGFTYGWSNQGGDGLYYEGTDKYSGVFGIRNRSSNAGEQWHGYNIRQRWTLVVDPPIGSTGSGYNPMTGTRPDWLNPGVEGDELGGLNDPSFRRALKHDGTDFDVLHILKPFSDDESNHFSDNPAVWETEPKESVDIDIYYQASGLIPLSLNETTNEGYIPIGSTFTLAASEGEQGETLTTTHTVSSWTSGESFNFTPAVSTTASAVAAYTVLTFTRPNGSSSTAVLKTALSFNTSHSSIVLHGGAATNAANNMLITQKHVLNWNNCWSFGNGVESDRIRDDFNAPQMDNGVKASTVLETSIKEEPRKHGLIWSGIYNSTVGVNDTNQFIAAEKITKDLNPSHGSIQKLYNRNTKLIILCEDKVLRAVTNKDALYNADGNPQLVASNAVVGDVQAYQGNFGISKNPESFVATPYQIYFADAMRGQVLALSGEGVRSISDLGMRDYFGDNLSSPRYQHMTAIGSYDIRKNEYNLMIAGKHAFNQFVSDNTKTISYSEASKGWTSFKSFIPESGLSINNDYYTFYNGHIWKHHAEYAQDGQTLVNRNSFYGAATAPSTIKMLFNDKPEAVKSWQTINYEGSQGKIPVFDYETVNMFNNVYGTGDGLVSTSNVSDGEFYNLGAAGTDTDQSNATKGWYVSTISTNLQDGEVVDFKEKEGKWFGQICGTASTLQNIDVQEFSTQGLGIATVAHDTAGLEATINFNINNTDD
tara:strand:- start:11552 stop:17431 length:5880 start_codon:yes stop_codon:yes gene_type:complete